MLKKIRVSEGFSLIFGNLLFVICVFSAYWGWAGILCAERDYTCQYIADLRQFIFTFGCIVPLLLWIIFTICAVASNKESGNKRIGALRFALVAMPCLLLVWAIAAFITDYQILVIAIALCLVLAATDILYVRALVLEHKV